MSSYKYNHISPTICILAGLLMVVVVLQQIELVPAPYRVELLPSVALH